MPFNLFYENALFFGAATSFFVGVGWAWRHTKPYELPHPLPGWFRIWFLTVQIGGIGLPLIGLAWCLWRSYTSLAVLLLSYFLMLGLQILSESMALRRFQSTVFVMVPYLYLPYRIWQLYEGLTWLDATDDLVAMRTLLLMEIVLWTANYALDLAQLPRLLHWERKDNDVS